jgi:hypothetical protein
MVTQEQINQALRFIDDDPSMGNLVHRSYAKIITEAYREQVKENINLKLEGSMGFARGRMMIDA